MSMAICNAAGFLTAGQLAVAANATIEVRRESDSGLASIFSNRAGTTPITNPSAFADASGRFSFYAAASQGGFSILVTKGAESFTLRNVPLGTGQEFDVDPWWVTAFAAASAAAARLALGAASLAALTRTRYGHTYAHNAVDVTNDWDIAAGGCMDVTGAYWITTAALTKQADVAWAVGNAAGMLDTGAVGNSEYYIFAIARSDTGVTDYLSSLSPTAPTMPANYDYKRLIGYFRRLAGVNTLLDVYENAGGGIVLAWRAPTLDVNLAATLTTSRRTDAVKAPTAFATLAHLNVLMTDAGSAFHVWIACPDTTDAAPSATVAPLSNASTAASAAGIGRQMMIRTDAAGLIAARASLATVDLYAVSTMGFTWDRRN